MYCTKCGKEIKQEHRFCPDCGTAVSQEKDDSNSSQRIIWTTKAPKMAAVLIVTLVIIFGAINLIGGGGKNAIVGTWICTSDDEWLINFEKDGFFYDSDNYFLSGYYGYGDGYVGTWKILEDNKLYLVGEDSSCRLDFELRGNILTIYVENSVYDYYQFKKSK